MLRQPLNRSGLLTNARCLPNRLLQNIVITTVFIGPQDQIINIPIGLYAERSEENEHGNVCLDARNGGLKHGDQIVLGAIDNLDIIGLGDLVIVGTNTLDLYNLLLLDIRTTIAKDHGTILRHALQTHHSPLASHNNEVASIIFRTFSHRPRIDVSLVVELTIFGPDHDGNLSEMNIGKDTDFGFLDAASCMVNEGGGDLDIGIQGGRVGEISLTSIIWEHGVNSTVVLK